MSEPATNSSTSKTDKEADHQDGTTTPQDSSDQTEGSAAQPDDAVDRSTVVGEWLTMLARWSGRLIVVGVAGVLVLWGLSTLWAGLLPVILALIQIEERRVGKECLL